MLELSRAGNPRLLLFCPIIPRARRQRQEGREDKREWEEVTHNILAVGRDALEHSVGRLCGDWCGVLGLLGGPKHVLFCIPSPTIRVYFWRHPSSTRRCFEAAVARSCLRAIFGGPALLVEARVPARLSGGAMLSAPLLLVIFLAGRASPPRPRGEGHAEQTPKS